MGSLAFMALLLNPGMNLVAVVDLNLDGNPDLVWAGPNGQISVWFMAAGVPDHIGSIGAPGELANWTVAGFADFNHDGHPDMLLERDGVLLTWYLTGEQGTRFLASATMPGLTGWQVAALGDWNGDGNPDILWQNPVTHRAVVEYLNAAGLLQSFAPYGGVTPGGPAPPVVSLEPVPMAAWNGINYSPRYHSYFRMLKDWNEYDARLGMYVYQAADADMELLRKSGYNLLHLYLWDRRLLHDAVEARWCYDPGCVPPYSEPSGFPDFPELVASTREGASQFDALQDFVARAELHGLYVALHFASGTLLDQVSRLPTASCDVVSDQFAAWAGQFITALTPVHRNVLLWGTAFAFGPDATGHTDLTGDASIYNRCFGQVYRQIDGIARKSAPPGMAGVLGLIGVNPLFEFVTPPTVRDGQFARPAEGYHWDVATTGRAVQTMTDELTALYGHPKSPDIYMFSFYNANAADLARNLQSLAHSIPADRIFPIEFATSSAGAGAESWGDSQTPTTTVEGQNAWLTNTLCAFRAVGIRKSAYWAMYDPVTLWTNAPWFNSGQQLAWNGYWGLAFEQPALSLKPAWLTLAQYNRSPDSLKCDDRPEPNLSAWTLSDYITAGQSPKIVWTATETTGLRLDGKTDGASWACDGAATFGGAVPFSAALGGSCAFTFGESPNSLGPHSYVLTASNNGREQTATLQVTIGLAPVISDIYIENGILSITGKGFSLSPVNFLRWTRPGFADVFLYQGDRAGHYFHQDAFHIATVIDSRITPGTWIVRVYNGQSATPTSIGAIDVR